MPDREAHWLLNIGGTGPDAEVEEAAERGLGFEGDGAVKDCGPGTSLFR
jgi:hypothetical protein